MYKKTKLIIINLFILFSFSYNHSAENKIEKTEIYSIGYLNPIINPSKQDLLIFCQIINPEKNEEANYKNRFNNKTYIELVSSFGSKAYWRPLIFLKNIFSKNTDIRPCWALPLFLYYNNKKNCGKKIISIGSLTGETKDTYKFGFFDAFFFKFYNILKKEKYFFQIILPSFCKEKANLIIEIMLQDKTSSKDKINKKIIFIDEIKKDNDFINEYKLSMSEEKEEEEEEEEKSIIQQVVLDTDFIYYFLIYCNTLKLKLDKIEKRELQNLFNLLNKEQNTIFFKHNSSINLNEESIKLVKKFKKIIFLKKIQKLILCFIFSITLYIGYVIKNLKNKST